MPVRLLNSSVLKWPDQKTVDRAVREWANTEIKKHKGIVRLGYFGSYARGDWGVGSDLDIIAVCSESTEPFERRNIDWDLTSLPVPAELLVYTEKEMNKIQSQGSRFAKMLNQETVWVYSLSG